MPLRPPGNRLRSARGSRLSQIAQAPTPLALGRERCFAFRRSEVDELIPASDSCLGETTLC